MRCCFGGCRYGLVRSLCLTVPLWGITFLRNFGTVFQLVLSTILRNFRLWVKIACFIPPYKVFDVMRHSEGVFKAACSAGCLQQAVCKRGVLLSVLLSDFLQKYGAVERGCFFGTGFGIFKRVVTGGAAWDNREAAELFRSQFRKR